MTRLEVSSHTTSSTPIHKVTITWTPQSASQPYLSPSAHIDKTVGGLGFAKKPCPNFSVRPSSRKSGEASDICAIYNSPINEPGLRSCAQPTFNGRKLCQAFCFPPLMVVQSVLPYALTMLKVLDGEFVEISSVCSVFR